MRYKNIRTVKHFLLEYGMTPGAPAATGDQQIGANAKAAKSVAAQNSPSPNTKATQQSIVKQPQQTAVKKDSNSPSGKSGKSPTTGRGSTEPEQIVVPASKVPVNTTVKNAKGKEVGVVVSPVGKKPRIDAVVLKDPKGKYTVATAKDKLIIDNPKAAKLDTTGDIEENRVNSRTNRLSKLTHFETLSLEEQLALLEGVDKAKLDEAWSKKYKSSIDCGNPKGFSQKAHCAGKKKNEDADIREGIDKNHPIAKEYESLKKHDIKTLRGMISQHHKVIDTSEFKTKDHAVSHLLRQKHGNKKVDQAFGLNEGAVPDNDRVRHARAILAKPLLGGDIRSQMEAFFVVPDPSMIKEFRFARGAYGDSADLRDIFRKYLTELHPSLKKQLNLRETRTKSTGELLNEYGSLDAAKQEIINALQSIDPNPEDVKIAKQNADILDKIYTILNSGNVLDRINAVLPGTLRGEYSEKDVVKIAQSLATAPITFAEKNQFADNLKNDKVIDASIFVSPGIYTVDQLTYGDPVNRKMLDHMKAYGVGQQMKGPLEHALAIFSKEISIAGKGDITVAGEPVEVKAAIGEKKGSGGGRFGETGRLPSREHMLGIINGYEQLKPLMDEYLATQKSMNISVFVDLVNKANLDPQTRADLGKKVFGTVFGAEAAPVVNAFVKPNADPDTVRKAYIVSNFNWYKNSDQGGEWKYLAGISLVDNAVGVIGTGEDLLRISAYKKNPSIITTDKPQEMLYQFNPKVA